MKHILFLLSMLVSSMGFACTTLVLKTDKGEVIFGRNFDFPVGMGHIHINYRNVQKVAFLPPPCNPVKWVSKYGNVTFNQAGREFPYGG